MKVSIKKLRSDAIIPKYSKEGDAGLDLVALDIYHNHDYKYVEFGTGLAIKVPENHVGLIFPRSSISKTSHSLRNSVAVIDENYTGELLLRFSYDENNGDMEYCIGDRIGQLVIMPIPKIDFEEVQELPETNRGSLAFGSSGR